MRVLFVLVSILLSFSAQTFSFQVDFSDNEFSPKGRNSRKTLVLINNSRKVEAVEIYAFKRAYDETGQEINEEVNNSFLIYPSQLILQPGSESVVTVVWVGETRLEKEEAFRIVLSQVPIDVSTPTEKEDGYYGKITVLTQFFKSAYVVPKGAAPKVGIVSVRPREIEGTYRCEVMLENSGTKHQVLINLAVTLIPGLDTGSQPVTIDDLGSPNLLAGERRKIVFDWPESIPFGPVRAEFHFKDIQS